MHSCAVRRGISSRALIHRRTHPEARADVTFSPLVTYPQMLYTNWPSTGNSFEGAFGGYDDVSVLAFPLVASFHIRVSHWSVQGLWRHDVTPVLPCARAYLCHTDVGTCIRICVYMDFGHLCVGFTPSPRLISASSRLFFVTCACVPRPGCTGSIPITTLRTPLVTTMTVCVVCVSVSMFGVTICLCVSASVRTPLATTVTVCVVCVSACMSLALSFCISVSV